MTITNISVAPEVKASLSGVLIDWLCKLAMSDGDRKNPVQTFVLTCGELSGKGVQDIRYADKQRRVFGVSPVTCRLQVTDCDHQYRMSMANEQGGTTK